MLDTTREVEVPEGITLLLPVAGLVSRSLAFLIDLLIRWTIIFIIAQVFSFFGNFGTGLLLLSIFLVEWFYPVLFEVLYHGQTLGKKVVGIMVINDDGTPIDWSSSIIRNLLRFADFLPLFYAFGFLSMLFSRDFKRLGDFVAGTIVIHKPILIQQQMPLSLNAVAPKVSLTLEEQNAIVSFAERSPGMPVSRVNELAHFLEPWLDKDKIIEEDGTAAIQLSSIAKWLRGQT